MSSEIIKMVFEYLFNSFGSPTIILIGTVIAAIYYQFIYKHWSYFSERGVKFTRGLPILGSNYKMLLGRESTPYAFRNLYNQFPNEKITGMYDIGGVPLYLLRDPELIKQIGIKEFEHFLNHRNEINEMNDPLLARNLFFIKNQDWKEMRSTLSPAFTGSKMRLMYSLMQECCDEFVRHLTDDSDKQKGSITYEMKDLFTRFANDTIASCAFGLKINSLADRHNEFYNTGKSITSSSLLPMLKFLGFASFPKLMDYLKVRIVSRKNENFFRSAVLNTIDFRQKNNIIRHDMIHLLLQAKRGTLNNSDATQNDQNIGFATAEESNIGKSNQKVKEFNETDIVAQCLIFLVAGFDTASTLLSFMAYELAVNPDIQQTLYEEIYAVHEKLNGEPMGYEELQKMKYLDMVISETLRKWPPAPTLDRKCNKSIVLDNNGTPLHIKAGTGLMIPLFGIHYDPKHYPEPYRFNPDRFSEENSKNITNCNYMPFGIGPRNCIGSRFALLECKAIFFQLLLHFKLVKCAKTEQPLKIATGFALNAENGFWMQVTRRY